MKRFFIVIMCMVACLAVHAHFRQSPSATKALTTAQLLQQRLQRLQKRGIMYGHQDDPFYGIGWQYEDGRSDVLDVAGDYPAVMGFELGGIEVDDEKNLDSVPFNVMRREIIAHHKRGGFVTISWHPRNPLTGGTAWVNPQERLQNTVAAVLPGGKVHGVFNLWLRRLTAFLTSLKDEQGQLIPIIFRPWHENSGSWFWWGQELCTDEEYRELWAMTQDYVAHALPHNILWAYSPNQLGHWTEEAWMKRYPGDDRVQIVGVDGYQHKGGEEEFVRVLSADLELLQNICRKHGKLLALTECGYQNIPDSTWWTRVLLPILRKYKPCYFLTWRNADEHQYFAPAPGTKDAADFRNLVQKKKILMLKDIAE